MATDTTTAQSECAGGVFNTLYEGNVARVQQSVDCISTLLPLLSLLEKLDTGPDFSITQQRQRQLSVEAFDVFHRSKHRLSVDVPAQVRDQYTGVQTHPKRHCLRL